MEQHRIIGLSRMILEQHRSHAEKYFIETQGYRAANKILRQHRRLIITGKSGQGKSYMARQLLREFIADNPDMMPMILSTADQWKTLVDSSITLGIIVDDMCGKFCLNERELLKWREESASMPGLRENGKHVVIFIMKSFFHEKILATVQSSSLFSTQVILNLDNIRLKFAEKVKFVNTYLKEFGLNNIEVSDLCEIHEPPVGFPLLCRMTEIIKERSRLFGHFSKPQEMILDQMKHIRRDDSLTYGCLVLVLLSRGKLNLQSVREFRDDSVKKENIIISVFRSCGIPDVIPIQILDTVKSLQGTYLLLDATEESYSFYHDSIEEAVFISYGEYFPEKTLLYSSLKLICRRCTIKYHSKELETTPQDNILILQPAYQTILINRFITALSGGNPKDFTIVSEANVWSCTDFRKAFFAQCKEIHFLADKDENLLLVHAANASNHYLVNDLLHELIHIPKNKKKMVAQFLANSAKALYTHEDTYLLEKICVNGCVEVSDILPISSHHGSANAMQSGGDVNHQSRNEENLVHIACLHGRLDIVKLLHLINANLVNDFDDDNQSIGFCVAVGGNVEILKYLLPFGLNPSHTDSAGWNLLHYACWEVKKDMVEYLVDKYPNLICTNTNESISAIFCAAFSGNLYIFKKLYEVMEVLLKHGQNAQENRKNERNYLMRKPISQETLLHVSCLGGQLEMTKYLVETYPRLLHEVDNCNRTPAHHAAESGNVAVLCYLINCGADPWCRTTEEETLMHFACINSQVEMTKYLAETYPKMLHEVDSSKRTPAHNAAFSGSVAVLRYLIDHGTDPWCRTSEEETLLHTACIMGQLEISKYLVQTYPTMLFEVDNMKRTPAHHAAESDSVAVLCYLIDCGTDPWCRTAQEETLLHRACIKCQFEMIQYLVETYPKMIDEVDNCKRTPADYAAQSDNVAVFHYLTDCVKDL